MGWLPILYYRRTITRIYSIPFLANYKMRYRLGTFLPHLKYWSKMACSVQSEYISLWNILHLNTLFKSVLNLSALHLDDLQIPACRIRELQACHGIALWTCFGAPSASDVTACTAFWRLSLWNEGLSMFIGDQRKSRTKRSAKRSPEWAERQRRVSHVV